ncbi:19408_t:CDS:1 [Gigaspora margarita]|uniref:19408_t:CDS:1 n=1 Tax=Gigaspora margarita TaxID=4874 RepID=A0ABN7W068_GIGMA|nr:19408_t:CDS:1 [Gigaspora margarita]
MSAITTKIVEKYNLSSRMGLFELSQYTSEFLENLTDDRKRNQARRRLQDGFKFSSEQVSVLIPNQKSGKAKVKQEVPCLVVNLAEGSNRATKSPDSFQVPDLTPQNSEETIRDLAQLILRDKLSIKDIRVEVRALANSAPNANAGSSCLSRLRRELKTLGAISEIIEATKFPDITKEANEIQQNRHKFVEAFEKIDYPDHFTLESVKERLDKYDISTLPNLQALVDVMLMLCIRPAKLTSLRITDAGVTGYAKNRGQLDIPRVFRSMEKNPE